MSDFLSPVTLEGRHATLEPLTREHVPALRLACADGDLWRLWYASVPTPDDMAAYVDKALAMQSAGTALPFAVRLTSSGNIVGCTRLYDVDAAHRQLTIGYTWYAASVQRSAVNTECKWLLLNHAFDTLKCIRVAWCTHWLNQRSRAAIERLGAKQEGVLRNHRILPDGSYRDTVMYSVIESEWPAVKRHLAFKLERNDAT
ncbi:MAG TPA: GNAT family protein [Rhodanobacteraceae bacterium]|nr:GNAT family protein [Rhodanobacteraceae bacterium]